MDDVTRIPYIFYWCCAIMQIKYCYCWNSHWFCFNIFSLLSWKRKYIYHQERCLPKLILLFWQPTNTHTSTRRQLNAMGIIKTELFSLFFSISYRHHYYYYYSSYHMPEMCGKRITKLNFFIYQLLMLTCVVRLIVKMSVYRYNDSKCTHRSTYLLDLCPI